MDENSPFPAPEGLDDRTAGLAAAVLEISRHVDADDLAGPRLFALVGTAQMLRDQPSFGALLDEVTLEAAREDPQHLTPIEMEAPASADPLDLLAEAAWPDVAAGGAIVCELGEVAIDNGPQDAARRLGSGSVRAVVAARTDASTWCALRGSDRSDLLMGPRLVPGLADAMVLSLGGEISAPAGD